MMSGLGHPSLDVIRPELSRSEGRRGSNATENNACKINSLHWPVRGETAMFRLRLSLQLKIVVPRFGQLLKLVAVLYGISS